MGTTPTNTPAAPTPKINRIGLQVIDYRGGKTTLCAGCGHNAISERIIDAMYEMGVPPERVAKFSGIGCSSKSPAYFMNRSHSFNSVHGRMPSVATGAVLANKNLMALGVTGDGDSVGRDVCGEVVFGRQAAASHHAQGGDCPSGNRDAGCGFAVCYVQ